MLSLVRIIFTLVKHKIDVKKIKTHGIYSKSPKAEQRGCAQKALFRKAKDAFFSFLLKNALSFSIIFLILFANILIVSAGAIRMLADRLIVFTDSLIGQVGRVGLV